MTNCKSFSFENKEMHRYLCVDNRICHKEYLIMVNVLFFCLV